MNLYVQEAAWLFLVVIYMSKELKPWNIFSCVAWLQRGVAATIIFDKGGLDHSVMEFS